jgi:hypothetical protein
MVKKLDGIMAKVEESEVNSFINNTDMRNLE